MKQIIFFRLIVIYFLVNVNVVQTFLHSLEIKGSIQLQYFLQPFAILENKLK